MATHLTPRERVLIMLDAHGTLGRVAEILGISIRTARRWKNEGTEPTKPHREQLVKKSKTAIRVVKKKSPQPSRTFPVPLKATRRQLRKYVNGRWTGEYFASHWLNYHVSTLDYERMLDLLRVMRDGARDIQFIYLTAKGRAVTPIITGDKLSRMTDFDLEIMLLEILWRYREDEADESENVIEDAPNVIEFLGVLDIGA